MKLALTDFEQQQVSSNFFLLSYLISFGARSNLTYLGKSNKMVKNTLFLMKKIILRFRWLTT